MQSYNENIVALAHFGTIRLRKEDGSEILGGSE